MAEWFEDDAYWEAVRPRLFTAERWAAAADEVRHITELLEITPPAAILDLCCGTGRHALEFARQGFRVTAVDLTESFLEEGRERARAEGLTVEWIRDDMRDFVRAGAFDVAVNLFTSFGYFENAEDDKKVVANVYSSLRQGGSFVLDLTNKEDLERRLGEGQYSRDKEDRWIVIENPVVRERPVRQRVYSAAGLISLLRECGFREATAFGDLAGAPYDHTAKRLVVVGKK